jgi:hypothetical protein
MLKLLFLISIVITATLTILNIMGFGVMDAIIAMIIIDFLSLGGYIELENKKVAKESKDFVASKIEGVEKVCNDILSQVRSPNQSVEAMIEKQKHDVSYILDKITKKSLELEERLNLFGRVLSNNLVEKKEDEVEEEPEVTQIDQEKAKQDSYSVGEIVYITDDEQ